MDGDDDELITPIEVPRNVTAPCLLVELEPEWIFESQDDQRRVGIRFQCACHRCHGWGVILAVRFSNPIGGGPPSPDRDALLGNNEGRRWQRLGETFETLTITPSIDVTRDASGALLAVDRRHWHGLVTNGHVT